MKVKIAKRRGGRKKMAMPKMGAPVTRGGMKMGRGISMTSAPMANPAPDIGGLLRGKR